MRLEDAKVLLERHNIPYQTAQYENEGAYFQHLTGFSYPGGGGNSPVTALVIPAVNGRKHIELQFNRVRGRFRFSELWFGGCGFDLGDQDPDLLAADILESIGRIVDGKLIFLESSDPRRKKRIRAACFDLTSQDQVFGAPGFREAMARIQKPRNSLQKLFQKKLRHEIYDWKSCQIIEP